MGVGSAEEHDPPKEREGLRIVILSVADLGLPEGATTGEVYAAATERGLDLCPGWVGPQLRLDHHDQPEGEFLSIAMEPVSTAGDPRVFGVDRSGGERELSGRLAHPDMHWNTEDQWVFCIADGKRRAPSPRSSA